jgi:3-deoxy-D-manno-octulosonic-acid transferase
MEFLYSFAIAVYSFGIRIAAWFYPKAAEWVDGRRHWQRQMSGVVKPGEKRIWFHCSSLGEYEQGRPVLERLRDEYPYCKIVLTFFSPSGYRQKKNDPLADYVFYLPHDGRYNSRRFIEIINPYFAVFVKYEFWHFYIKVLKEKKIPSFVISAIFRPSQIYFKNYGKFFYMILQRITHLFVQNQSSLELLYDNKLPNVTVSGDTRFDRVYANSLNRKELKYIPEFKNGKPLFIAGSTWPADEKILLPLIEAYHNDIQFVIVPHEISAGSVHRWKKHIRSGTVLYSELNAEHAPEHSVLIIDNVGMLSALYRYADFAYIGGGFGAGIHNTLEAAVFGIPVFFGPNYKKFAEAIQLTLLQTAFSVTDLEELEHHMIPLLNDSGEMEKIRQKNQRYIDASRGATDVILNYLKMNYPG